MPWQEVSAMSQRREMVALAEADGIRMRELCRRFGVSPPTAYKWLRRYRAAGASGLQELSRRPLRSPKRTPPEMETAVLEMRAVHPAWGGRKLRRWLLDKGLQGVPSPSTITAILHRHDLIDAAEAAKHRPWQRFEYTAPNQLWQMDFKGHFALARGRCHPLTVLDDCSRFSLVLEACPDETGVTVQQRLTNTFRRYGLPEAILADNGAPWGCASPHPYTPLTVWLLRLGVGVRHGRPYHPQTQGKEERFHRSLEAEVLQGRWFDDLASCQAAFDQWRAVYNLERPHEALGLATPASRYKASPRPFTDVLPPIDYGPGAFVRRVQAGGELSFQGRTLQVGKAFRGYPVALRPTTADGVWQVSFVNHTIAQVDLRSPDPYLECVNDVSEHV